MMAQARPETSQHEPIIWLVNDDQPGHLSQLAGLGQRLESRCGGTLYWIPCRQYPLSLWRWLLARPPDPSAPKPDLIIGAGRRTHRLLHALGRYHRVPAVVLMRPSLPLSCFDAAIIPAHDQPPKRSGVFTTLGAINRVEPLAAVSDQKQGLILLGGPSRHFRWSDQRIESQIIELCRQRPDWQWHLSDSRRTPSGLIEALSRDAPDNLQVHHHQTTGPDWVHQQLAESRLVWVSPDSVSMVFEALTAGVPTGLFELEPVQGSRVARAITQLRDQNRVFPWRLRGTLFETPPAPATPLWEADRAAQWLIERFNLGDEAAPREGPRSHD